MGWADVGRKANRLFSVRCAPPLLLWGEAQYPPTNFLRHFHLQPHSHLIKISHKDGILSWSMYQ